MLNNLNILFLILTMVSSIFAISTFSWFSAWMGLELNLLSFVPLLIEQKNSSSNESALKYFLVQAMASSLFITLSLMNTFSFFSFSIFDYQNFNLLMIPLIIKLGAAPFHPWFITLMNKLNWYKAFLLATWQKIAPLCIFNYLNLNMNLVMSIAFLSLFVGAIGGLTQTMMQKILAFSSVSHLGWLLTTTLLSKQILSIYFIMYMLMNMLLFTFLYYNNIFHFNQNLSQTQLLCFSIGLLSLSGLPPFIGFLPKWMVVQNLILSKYLILSFILIAATLITLIFYIRLILNFSLLLSSSPKWFIWQTKSNLKMSKLLTFLTVSSMLGLMMFNFIF
uniref:NADH-ubiquinone oxidoreductase chain 2 n=1 Tax=Lachesilla pedicularia TaxID=1897924 RepID=A0A8K1ZFS3_9NEOP|nr:NADH dehydrogenase subunit 2 [Lachesilla pedicularia]